MKRFLSLFVFICLLALSITACNNGNNANSNDAKYAEAITLLEQGKNAEAYDILKELGDYKDAQEMLTHFYYVPSTVLYFETFGTQKTYHYTYEQNRLIKIQRENASYVYTYDANGNLQERLIISPDNTIRSEFVHDENGNLCKKAWYYGEEINRVYEYTYDSNGNIIQEVYYERLSVYDPNLPALSLQHTIDYTYDANNRVVKKVRTSDSKSTISSYLYDTAGNLVEETINDKTYRYSYDESGKILNKTLGDDILEEYIYDANGHLLKHSYRASPSDFYFHTHEYTYNADGQLIREVDNGPGTKIIREYSYDTNGNMIYKTKTIGDSFYAYTYDVHGNLIKHLSIVNQDQITRKITYQLLYLPNGIPEAIEQDIYTKY